MILRPAVAADNPAIWDILRPVFQAGDTYTVDPGIAEHDAIALWTDARTYVAEIEGRVLATYYLRPNKGGGGAHICNCGYATHPDARGRGLASAMLDHSLAEARAQGYRGMQFNCVVTTNDGAIRLWKRAGFAEVGRLPGVFLHPDAGFPCPLQNY